MDKIMVVIEGAPVYFDRKKLKSGSLLSCGFRLSNEDVPLIIEKFEKGLGVRVRSYQINSFGELELEHPRIPGVY